MESGCDPNSPECWCPCGCGCQNDPNGGSLPFDEKGLCASCSRGVHEVPPESVRPLEDLIAVHKSILVHLHSLQSLGPETRS